MDAITLLTQKGVKKIEAREQLVSAIADDSFSLGEFKSRVGELNDKQIATFLEAVEAVTGKKLKNSVQTICASRSSIFCPTITPASAKRLALSAIWRQSILMN